MAQGCARRENRLALARALRGTANEGKLAAQQEVHFMGRSTGRNLRNRRKKQQIKKKLKQQDKRKSKLQAVARG